jgi:hypothetical protein
MTPPVVSSRSVPAVGAYSSLLLLIGCSLPVCCFREVHATLLKCPDALLQRVYQPFVVCNRTTVVPLLLLLLFFGWLL